MKILMRILEEERPMFDDSCELASILFDIASDAYDECAGDSEAYLTDPDYSLPMDKATSLLDGKADPEGIVKLARGWNEGLAADFQRILSEAEKAQTSGTGAQRWLSVPSQTMYALKKAVRALDGDFYTFAENALLVNEHRYFTTRLTDEELSDIEKNPGNYAVIEVYPK